MCVPIFSTSLSNGATIPALRRYRQYEAALAIAKRAGNKRRVRAIHAKIANARKRAVPPGTESRGFPAQRG
jgi:hypothetical protein